MYVTSLYFQPDELMGSIFRLGTLIMPLAKVYCQEEEQETNVINLITTFMHG